ncbi:MAG: DNA polymerase IV, partial [Agathobacter sp.]|nr:DNA polymerase IV [Agathobacter sp.]
MAPVIFHIDVNSAFLSWEATYRMRALGETTDLRQIPCVVGGSEEARHGIVLAKSEPAKKYGIITGEPLVDARRKCPNLVTVAPRFPIYVEY